MSVISELIDRVNDPDLRARLSEVRSNGSKLPEVDIEKYVCETIL